MPTAKIRIVCLLATLALGACAISDEKLSNMMVAPGKFVLYSCTELAQRAKTNAEREQQLHVLMAKAQTGAGGDLVNKVAYQPELATLEGEDRELQQTAADKKCTTSLPTAASSSAAGAPPRAGASR